VLRVQIGGCSPRGTAMTVGWTRGTPSTARIAQTSGMVSVQADRGLDDALRLMSVGTRVDDRTVAEIAVAVVDGEIRLDDAPTSGAIVSPP
jgi:hypothetical protein